MYYFIINWVLINKSEYFITLIYLWEKFFIYIYKIVFLSLLYF